jgi:hypothetical protein
MKRTCVIFVSVILMAFASCKNGHSSNAVSVKPDSAEIKPDTVDSGRTKSLNAPGKTAGKIDTSKTGNKTEDPVSDTAKAQNQ